MLLAGGKVEAREVESNLAQIERDVLREAHLVRRIGQDRIVDHLGVAVTLRLHGRGAKTEFGMFVGAEMVLQYLHPGCVEARGRTGFTAVFDGVLHHAANRRLALVMRTLPFLVDGAEFMPIGAFCGRPILTICRRSVGERDDPILQEITFGIGLNIDRHIFVVCRLATLGFEVIVLATVGARKRRGSCGPGFDECRLRGRSARLCAHC